MSQRQGETAQQWMDRLRAARGLPPQTRENLFEQVAAARTFIEGQRTNRPDLELFAFMSIFHPDHPLTNDRVGLAAIGRELVERDRQRYGL